MRLIQSSSVLPIFGGLALSALFALATVAISGGPAGAVVYCKTVGVVKGQQRTCRINEMASR